ncbi:hypothetical protein ANN_26693 [Periplaneta americana]|uniref:DUF4817 domain-containing protein n=1 Tax=Periplaneta americana TaxID=6978 RepID=A0ABQ8RYT7_PERAM|nr:hypothetical protein ANN_26693 [Periplaneta americana]
MQYTLNQRLFLVKQYWVTNSITATQRAYQREFGVRNPPKRNTILGLVNKLETIGSLTFIVQNPAILSITWNLWPPRSSDFTTLDNICYRVGENLKKTTTSWREPISSEARLMLTLSSQVKAWVAGGNSPTETVPLQGTERPCPRELHVPPGLGGSNLKGPSSGASVDLFRPQLAVFLKVFLVDDVL